MQENIEQAWYEKKEDAVMLKEKVRIMRNHSPNQSNNGKLLKKLKNQSVQDKDTEKKKKPAEYRLFLWYTIRGSNPGHPD